MNQRQPLQYGCIYHIYNRGNNRENLFFEERNYRFFLQLYARHIEPIADTFGYCLLRNHFHFLIRVKSQQEIGLPQANPSQCFANLFNAYSKAINKAYQRTGSLFEERFGRIEVTNSIYFTHLLFYIHFNPQKHGFVSDFREWPWSSFHGLMSGKPTRLQRASVLEWFGGVDGLQAFHHGVLNEKAIQPLIGEDFD